MLMQVWLESKERERGKSKPKSNQKNSLASVSVWVSALKRSAVGDNRQAYN